MRQRYQNLDGIEDKKTFADLWRWSRERRKKVKDVTKTIPQAEHKMIHEIRHNRKFHTYTWIGHATFLIQAQGLNILTDPVWAKWMGTQKRLTDPGLALHELPDIDIVLISHGHYDHLDFRTLRRLPGKPAYYVPAGLKKLFMRKGFQPVEEANWWDSFQHQSLTLHFVPAQHWTRRTLFDMNTSHWGGWVIESAERTYYFVGDTGYFRGFIDIGNRFSIDTVFMPIGAYEPEWFMKFHHINPEDAVKAFMECQAHTFVPMHYGTFRLADDIGPEALERLINEWDRRQLPHEQLKILKLGETFIDA